MIKRWFIYTIAINYEKGDKINRVNEITDENRDYFQFQKNLSFNELS